MNDLSYIDPTLAVVLGVLLWAAYGIQKRREIVAARRAARQEANRV